MSTIAITCLSEAQQQQLQGVQVGDFLRFQEHYEQPEDDDEPSDEEDDRDEDVESERDEEDGGDDAADLALGSTQGSINGERDEESDEEEGERDVPDMVLGMGSETSLHLSSGETSDSTNPTSQSEQEDERESIPHDRLYLVKSLNSDAEGAIEDLVLIELTWFMNLGHSDRTFYIFGAEIKHTHDRTTDCDCATTLSALAVKYEMGKSGIRLNEPAHSIHMMLSPGVCSGECDEGWLEHLGDLRNVLPPSIYASPATLDHHPVCPVCIGLPVLREQQNLRTTLEAFSMIQFEDGYNFTVNLNRRRAAFRYEFSQFDERDWNMLFDDMHEHDGGDDDQGVNAGNFEHWPEAMDPSSAPVQLSPASQATIDALPRKTYAEVMAEVDRPFKAATACAVCTEMFKDADEVIELPCKHVYHGDSCITQWLSQWDKCPDCRAKVPAVEVADAVNGEEGLYIEGIAEDEEPPPRHILLDDGLPNGVEGDAVMEEFHA